MRSLKVRHLLERSRSRRNVLALESALRQQAERIKLTPRCKNPERHVVYMVAPTPLNAFPEVVRAIDDELEKLHELNPRILHMSRLLQMAESPLSTRQLIRWKGDYNLTINECSAALSYSLSKEALADYASLNSLEVIGKLASLYTHATEHSEAPRCLLNSEWFPGLCQALVYYLQRPRKLSEVLFNESELTLALEYIGLSRSEFDSALQRVPSNLCVDPDLSNLLSQAG
jgi:hypothetical protein